jgi:hypothetical protein
MILNELYAPLEESSGYSLAGSYTTDLILSKIWLARELQQVMRKQGIDSVPVAYVLGSWYSNLSTILRKANTPIERIIDVEKNAKWLRQGKQMQQSMNIDGVDHMRADANQIDYRQLQDPGLVINTSTTDIPDHGWFDNIPSGTLVVLQGRDNVQASSEHNFGSPDQLLELFPLEKVLFKDKIKLEDPETDYIRSMVIGIKGQEQLRELTFMGMSPCTKDCSGHRAGYQWSKARGGVSTASWSDSFNRGAEIAKAGY